MNHSNYRAWLLSGLFILWLFAVFGGFYLVQKPFTLATARSVANVGLDILAASWLAILGLGLGQRLLRWLPGLEISQPAHPKLEPSTGEILILGCGLGLGALGLAMLGIGLAGLLYPWFLISLSLLLTLLLWPDWPALLQRWRRWQPSRPPRFTLIYLTALALLTLALALLPPVDWDGLFYHLTGPKHFIQTQAIRPGVDIPHFNFPFLAEMLFTYGMLLQSDIAAKLSHTLYGLLLVGLVYLTASRHLSRESAWPSVLILLSMPMIITLAAWAYNDLTLTFYQLAALYALLRFRASVHSSDSPSLPPNINTVQIGRSEHASRQMRTGLVKAAPHLRMLRSSKGKLAYLNGIAPNMGWLLLSGIFAGLGMGLKYTGFVGPLALGLILLWWIARKQFPDFPAPLLLLAYFAGPALAIALPWYLKNFFFTGNPFYPFLSGVFDGLWWDQFRAEWYAQAGTGIGFDLSTLAGLPVLATLGVRDVNYFDGRTGPLFLAFLPLILLYGLFRYRAFHPQKPAALDVLLMFALAQFLFWTFGVIWSRSLWQSRLLLPCLATLSPVLGWLWQDLQHLKVPHFSLYRFVTGLIGLVLVFNLIEVGLHVIEINPLAYLTGQETRAEHLTRRLGAHYAAMQQLNQTLPPEAVVLFLWEPRTYFCQVECRPDSILDQWLHAQYLYGDAAQIVEAWRQAGITHVLLHRQGLDFIKGDLTKPAEQAALEQLAIMERRYFVELFDTVGAYQLYALR